MIRIQMVLLMLLAGVAIGACGVVPRSSSPPQTVDTGSSPPLAASEPQEEATTASSLEEVKTSLMQAYRDWEGTPYKLGGASPSGVDCSRFVHIVFDDYFDIELPTNTRTQLNAGDGIRRAGIRTGDLVFFKTGRKTLHVGIAVNRGEFLHASTSSGVMISKLGNSYWRNRFLSARRLL